MSGLAATSLMDVVGANKRHDTYPRTREPPMTSTASSWSTPRRRRIFLGIVVAALLYFFVKNIPTDVPPVSQRVDIYGAVRPQHGQTVQDKPATTPGQNDQTLENTQSFDGPIKYNTLGATLRSSTAAMIGKASVLFAVSSPMSASSVFPFACQMAQQNRTLVHMAVMGRQPVSVEELMSLHGISGVDCPLHWHDARPDSAVQSTTERMERAVKAALGHFHAALTLDTVLYDESSNEDTFFVPTMKGKAESLSIPLIELPNQAHERLAWLATLDSTAMKQWSRVQIDIVIQAPLESSGSLLRLLKSIEHADYTGFAEPRIIIELPYDVELPLISFFSHFRWPPGKTPDQSKLTLRHRIKSKHETSLEANLRTLELFYPTSPLHHVLILDPNVVLSPNYYHYLMYNVLEYKHTEATRSPASQLSGISLDMPRTNLAAEDLSLKFADSETLLLWQMPGRHATLWFGEKWIEFHDFLSRRLASDPRHVRTSSASAKISDKYPSWLGLMLELMRCRDYHVLYPAFTTWRKDASLAVMHEELHQQPEEYIEDEHHDPNSKAGVTEFNWNGPLTADIEEETKGITTSVSISLSSLMSLDTSSEEHGRLPPIENVAMRSYTGDATTRAQSSKHASVFAEDFSLEVGGCASLEARDPQNVQGIEHLFCKSMKAKG